MPTSTTPSSPARPTSSTDSAQHGSSPALYSSALAAAALRPGRAQTPPTRTNSESTLSIPPSTPPMPQLRLLLRANVHLVDHGTPFTGQSLRAHMRMLVLKAVDIQIG